MNEEITETSEDAAVAQPVNRTTALLLGVIALLLIAVVVILLTSRSPQAATTGGTTPGTTMPPASATAVTAFDPATATQVEAGVTPEEYVKKYFDAIVAQDYNAAYNLLPVDKKSAQSPESFADQLGGYGIGSYTIDNATEEADTAEVLATANAQGMGFQYLWTFVKDGDTWLVKSREMPGMGQ